MRLMQRLGRWIGPHTTRLIDRWSWTHHLFWDHTDYIQWRVDRGGKIPPGEWTISDTITGRNVTIRGSRKGRTVIRMVNPNLAGIRISGVVRDRTTQAVELTPDDD